MLHGAGLQLLRARLKPRLSAASTIAVVGSSGNLLSSRQGIDAHSLVIRVNGAVTAGYEDDVGSATHLRLAWTIGVQDICRARLWPDQLLIYWVPHNMTNRVTGNDGTGWRWRREATMAGCPKMRELQRLQQVVQLQSAWAGSLWVNHLQRHATWPSTGFVAVAIAVALARWVGARSPTLFGFGGCRSCAKYCAPSPGPQI